MQIDPSQVLNTIAGLVLLILLGSVLKSFQLMPAEFAPMINRVVLSVTLPALVFRSIRKTAEQGAIGPEILYVPLVAALVIVGCGLVGYGMVRVLKLERKRAGPFLLAVMFGSTAFVGYPLFDALSKANPEVGAYHVFYSELGLLVPLVTIGFLVASTYGEGKRFSWNDLLAIPRSAPFIALMMGLLFYKDPLPGVFNNTVDVLANSTSFLMMFSLGLTIVWRDLTTFWQANLLAGVVRLIVGPLLALVLSQILPMPEGPMRQVVVIDSAMPAILLSLVYAGQFKLDVKFASGLVFTNFLFSLPTLLVILLLATPH
jgi:predicted permease